MDIFDRNIERKIALQKAIDKAEAAIAETEEYQLLQLLKKQRKLLPNNQCYTMSDLEWTKAQKLGPEALAAHRKEIDNQNNADWDHNEKVYQAFCRVQRVNPF